MELRLKKLELIKAIVLFFLPIILIIVNKEMRPSISDYAYSVHNGVFYTLMSLSGTLYIYNGVINRSKWYNIVLGLALIGIGLTPHLDYPFWHYLFACVYFTGSIIVIPIFTSNKQRKLKLILSLLITISLLGFVVFDWYSLFIAEWLALTVICFHFIGESIGKFD